MISWTILTNKLCTGIATRPLLMQRRVVVHSFKGFAKTPYQIRQFAVYMYLIYVHVDRCGVMSKSKTSLLRK